MTLTPDLLEMVERFNKQIIGLPVPDVPTRLDPVRKLWALEALDEETTEFAEATTLEDEVDALIDLIYFALGRIIEMGVAPGPVFEEVHEANMLKQRGEQSKRPSSKGYDAVKPEGWTPPDLRPYLKVRRSDLEALTLLDELAERYPVHENIMYSSNVETGTNLTFDRVPESNLPNVFVDIPNIFADTEPAKPKILVIGYARHGKDTVAGLLENLYGLTFTSSSEFCAGRVIMPAIEDAWHEYHSVSISPKRPPSIPTYESEEACFEDRVNHRDFWYRAIKDFNRPDLTALGRAIFEENDVYCGVRSPAELHAMVNAGLTDVVVWVDRGEHLPPESVSSCEVEPWMADYVIDNNGSLDDLERNVRSLFDRLMEEH